MFQGNIKQLTKDNSNFRQVLCTGSFSQLVLMSLAVGEEIGEETHLNTDQILCIVEGDGEAKLNGELVKVEKHDLVFIPAGTKHNLTNRGSEELKLFTIYSPPTHPEGLICKTKEDAMHEESEY